MNIRIITDSASDIIEGQYPLLSVLPMTITFGEEQFSDGVNLSREEFYSKLVETDCMPSTSQIPPYRFEEEFKRLSGGGAGGSYNHVGQAFGHLSQRSDRGSGI